MNDINEFWSNPERQFDVAQKLISRATACGEGESPDYTNEELAMIGSAAAMIEMLADTFPDVAPTTTHEVTFQWLGQPFFVTWLGSNTSAWSPALEISTIRCLHIPAELHKHLDDLSYCNRARVKTLHQSGNDFVLQMSLSFDGSLPSLPRVLARLVVLVTKKLDLFATELNDWADGHVRTSVFIKDSIGQQPSRHKRHGKHKHQHSTKREAL